MRKTMTDAQANTLNLYEKLVATNPEVERKGDTMPYTSLNGHMFSLLTKEGTLALRLPAEEREAFLKKYKTKLAEQYGTVLKEYVEVPDALLKKTREMKKYFDISHAYVGSLKPKPTKKKEDGK
jgi:TfoX/Sxy family transcriptional regulator of competence genes